MDDIVVATTGRLDALQLKHSTSPKGRTLASLLKPAAGGKLSLIRQLANGWRALKKAHPDRVLTARLVFRGIPTSFGQLDDQITVPEGENFYRFLLEGWESIPSSEDLAKWSSLRDAIVAEGEPDCPNVSDVAMPLHHMPIEVKLPFAQLLLGHCRP